MVTWRQLISSEMKVRNESWDDVVSCTLCEAALDVDFYEGFGGSCGQPFSLWTARRVYFPVVYDGAEWVESVSRDPDGVPTPHMGGQ